MECVNVLFRGNCVDNCLFVNVLRQRELNENSVNSVVTVENIYKVKKLFLCCVFVKSILKGLETYSLTSLFLVVNVNS